MTTFVITVPGTFVTEVPEDSLATLKETLAKRHTDVSRSEGLDLLTLNEDGTFSIRLEVEAADRYTAELDAAGLVSTALREAGLSDRDAPIGTPVVTGIDSDL
ncbi:hypothetical protein EDD93_4944 [Streptomyces sp. 840.1]|uniref:hypothetical protein n=1 Tax=Streptomyces sp. 840.1 TaxID=2485152 RepID=UPI000F4A2418|nr:hypothetical protein [Streptomyces sp. 840.1]ROQ70421.1 hypothetical protein EDD93_4944 [Streptomyces sp. 840.1]